MIHEILPVGPLQCNCSILGDETSLEAIVVDPGDEIARIIAVLDKHNLTVKQIVITHAHIDHIAGAFGGQGSQTAFGPRGAANLLTKLTTYSAILFMLTSIGLTIMLSRASGDHSVLSGTAHPTSQTTPKK